MGERDAFELYASKAPVNIPGPQAKAHRAWIIVRGMLTKAERNRLMVARSHALTGEGRAEFDRVMGEIRSRLWPA